MVNLNTCPKRHRTIQLPREGAGGEGGDTNAREAGVGLLGSRRYAYRVVPVLYIGPTVRGAV